jgi:hypothetical protein
MRKDKCEITKYEKVHLLSKSLKTLLLKPDFQIMTQFNKQVGSLWLTKFINHSKYSSFLWHTSEK